MQTDAKNIDADTLDALVEFHGHMCPGLAMGCLLYTSDAADD